MLFRLLKITFWSWWDNLSYSIITSFMAATNPFFLILLSTFMFYLTGNHDFFVKYKDILFIIILSSIGSTLSFPTTISAYSIHERILTNTYSSYFVEYWQEFKRLFFKGIILTILNIIISIMLAYSILFYNNFLNFIYPFNWIFIGLSIWLYILFLISQIYLIPMTYKEKENIFINYLISVYLSFKYGLYSIIILFLTIFSFLLFCIPIINKWTSIIPMISFFGFVSTLHIQFYRLINQEIPEDEILKKRSIKELFTPFLNIFKNKKTNKKG